MGYRRAGWEDELIGLTGFVLIVGVILAVAIIWTIVQATVKELGRLARRSGSYSKQSLHVIRWTLIGVAGVVGLCVLAGLIVPAVMTAAVYATAWGFLVVVLVIEACDWYERRTESHPPQALGDLDTYLDFTSPTDEYTTRGSSKGTGEPAAIGAVE